MTNQSAQREPTVASASPTRWRLWLSELVHFHKRLLGAISLTLLLGFGAAGLAFYLFADLANEVMDQETQALDLSVLHGLRQFASPTLDMLARALSVMGSEVVLGLLILLTGVFLYRRRWGAAASLLITTVGAQLLNNLLKAGFERPRPTPLDGFIAAQAYSFPSGHAMVSTAFYLFLAYLAWRTVRGWQRPVWIAATLLLVLGIGLSRLYLGVHYLTDVIGGYIAGFLWADTVILSGRLLHPVWRSQQAAPPADDAPSPSSSPWPGQSLSQTGSDTPGMSRDA
jgi:undecaprenyl-diphosphatase